MKRTARFLISAFVCAGVLMLAAPQASQAGGYATNGCVSKKTKAAGKFCGSVAKAWSKWHKDPSADPVGADRDASILASGDKLAAAWSKAEAQSASKDADCVEITDTSTAIRSQIETAIDTLQGTLGASADDADEGCRSKVLGNIGKFCSALLGNEAKFIKNPAKDLDRDALETASTEDTNAFTASYDSNDDACTTPIPPSGDAVTAIDELIDGLKENTRTSPNAPLAFTQVIPPTTVEYQGDTLQPICQKNTPYSFFYKRGTENKLLMYYQGGGACWSNATCWTIGTSKETTGPGDNPDTVGTGFADPDNALNIFKDWHVVFVSYCTGDVHWGDNAENSYTGGLIYHHGRHNAAVAEKWAREHFIDPDFVFVTGSSAGSYGAISNSAYLMQYVYPATEFAVLGDAGIGVVTQPWLETYQDGDPQFGGRVWNIQKNLPTFIPGIAEPVADLSLGGFISALANAFPNSRFASYESAYDGGDGGQTSFYHIMKSGSNVLQWPSWWNDQCEWTACMREFKQTIQAAAPNYRSYTGAGSRHTIYGSDKLYNDTTGPVPITFRDWVEAMIEDDVGWVNVDCADGGDCDPLETCQGGTNAGGSCSVNGNADCPGGSCDEDPDPNQGPYSGGSVTCAPMVCPCGGTGVNCP